MLDGTRACNGYCVLLAAVAGFCLFFSIYETSGKERKWVEGNGLQEIASGIVDDRENWRKQLRVKGELLSLISLTKPTTTESSFF